MGDRHFREIKNKVSNKESEDGDQNRMEKRRKNVKDDNELIKQRVTKINQNAVKGIRQLQVETMY